MSFKKSKSNDLNLLSETIGLMNKAKDFQVIADIIFNFIKRFINFDMAVIYKMNEKENVLEIVSCLGSDAERLKNRMPFRIGEGAVGLVAMDKKSILINDVLKTKEIKVRQFSDEDPLIRSFLAVPLVVGDKVIGILSVSCGKANQYDEYDVQMINIIASQGAVLLELNNNISEAQKFANQILENINSGVMVINNNNKIITFNKAAQKITGYLFNEIIGKDITSVTLKLDFEDECMKSGKIYFEEPGYMIRKDGNYLRIRLSTSLMYDDDNYMKNFICIFRDNTEIEILQRQITMADKLAALGRLTAGIVHEIRNPLLPIRNASEYLLKKYENNEVNESNGNNKDVVKLLSIIREESERLNRFLGQLININKDSLFSIGTSNLEEVLNDTLSLLKYGIESSNISLSLNSAKKDIILAYNKDNLKQILLNLILNSIDAINLNDIKRPRNIDIVISLKSNYSIVEIIDSGIGIPKEELDKVFDPFYTTKDSGTGIGLPIVFNIVNSVRGKILIDSSENIGTKITLLLPLANERKD